MDRRKARLWIGGLLLALLAAAQLPPVKIILVGDSTVATNNGWGPGFCADVAPEVKCINMAKNGRSTSSYRADGSWAQVMDELKRGTQITYVLIQSATARSASRSLAASSLVLLPSSRSSRRKRWVVCVVMDGSRCRTG